MKALNLLTALFVLPSVIVAAANEMRDVLARYKELETLFELFEVDPTLFDASQDPVDTTFLAPSNEAFHHFLKTNRFDGAYLTNKAVRFRMFKDIMDYHTIKGSYTTEEMFEQDNFQRTALKNISFSKIRGQNQVVRFTKMGDSGLVFGGFNEAVHVIVPDLVLWNGYIHVVDRFLRIPETISATAEGLGLNSWTNACRRAELDGVLNGLGKSTVFIPSYEADTSLFLGNTYPLELTDILQAHVVKDRVLYSTDLKLNEVKLTTMSDKILHITVRGDDIYVNGAKVVTRDVLTLTGVIHIIDSVLDPRVVPLKKANEKAKVDCTCNGDYCITSKGVNCTSTDADKNRRNDSTRKVAVKYGLMATISAAVFAILL